MVHFIKDYNYKTGWQIKPVFQVSVNKKDLSLLETIQKFFSQAGVIINKENRVIFMVSSLKEITNIIIPHFEKYPLVTKKCADYLFFKQVIYIMGEKKHLTLKGLKNILFIKASMNLELSEDLKAAFPNIKPATSLRSPVMNPLLTEYSTDILDTSPQKILNLDWLSGFSSAEGKFSVIIKSTSNKIGSSTVQMLFQITLHSEDQELMKNIVEYFGCGRIRVHDNHVNFTCRRFSDIFDTIIPFFNKHPIVGVKSLDFMEWEKVANLMQTNSHLTLEGLRQISEIKSGMNYGIRAKTKITRKNISIVTNTSASNDLSHSFISPLNETTFFKSILRIGISKIKDNLFILKERFIKNTSKFKSIARTCINLIISLPNIVFWFSRPKSFWNYSSDGTIIMLYLILFLPFNVLFFYYLNYYLNFLFSVYGSSMSMDLSDSIINIIITTMFGLLGPKFSTNYASLNEIKELLIAFYTELPDSMYSLCTIMYHLLERFQDLPTLFNVAYTGALDNFSCDPIYHPDLVLKDSEDSYTSSLLNKLEKDGSNLATLQESYLNSNNAKVNSSNRPTSNINEEDIFEDSPWSNTEEDNLENLYHKVKSNTDWMEEVSDFGLVDLFKETPEPELNDDSSDDEGYRWDYGKSNFVYVDDLVEKKGDNTRISESAPEDFKSTTSSTTTNPTIPDTSGILDKSRVPTNPKISIPENLHNSEDSKLALNQNCAPKIIVADPEGNITEISTNLNPTDLNSPISTSPDIYSPETRKIHSILDSYKDSN